MYGAKGGGTWLCLFACLFFFFFCRDGINICTALNWVMQHE